MAEVFADIDEEEMTNRSFNQYRRMVVAIFRLAIIDKVIVENPLVKRAGAR